MAKPTEEMFDKRTVERNMTKGVISRADRDKYLSKLPDMQSNVEWVDMDATDAEKASPEED